MLWTAEFEVTNIIKDIAINAKNMGDTRIVEPNQPIQKVFIDLYFSVKVLMLLGNFKKIQELIESTTKFVSYEEHFSNDGVSQGYLKSQTSCAELGIDLKKPATIAF